MKKNLFALSSLFSLIVLGQVACANLDSKQPLANNSSINTSLTPNMHSVDNATVLISKTHKINVNGITRTYHITIPANLNKAKPLPIIFSFHGFGSNAVKQQSLTNMSKLAADKGFIVIYPEGIANKLGRQYWNTKQIQDIQKDVDFVEAILASLRVKYPNQAQKVFATGISNGGGMAHVLATHMADKIVAIAPVAGAYYDYNSTQPSKPVAVMAFHGTKDRIVPYTGRRNLPNIKEWAGFWTRQNNCNENANIIKISNEIFKQRWQECQAPTILYTIRGLGHSWPGSNRAKFNNSQLDATEQIILFFEQFLRK